MKTVYAIGISVFLLCIAYLVGYFMGTKSSGTELRGEYERAVSNIAELENNIENAKVIIEQLTREREQARVQLEGIRTANSRARIHASNAGGAIGGAIYATDKLDGLLDRGEEIARRGAAGTRKGDSY